jgi:hypothetical protein
VIFLIFSVYVFQVNDDNGIGERGWERERELIKATKKIK